MTNSSMQDTSPSWAKEARDQALEKILKLASNVGPTFLHSTTKGRYISEPNWWWTSAFWPGLMRLVFDQTENAEMDALSKLAEDRLFDVLQTEDFYELHHDVGFQFLPTSVMRYKQTGCLEAKRRGLIGAQLLMGRFNTASGALEAWNGEENRGKSIIDSFMNVPLLFWASEVTGEPRFANLAKTHLETAIPVFIRADHSVHHIIRFDQKSGEKVEALGGQGFAPESAWSRGQSWAIYGLAIAFRYTGNTKYKELSRAVANKFLEMNKPHGVPPWDFRADNAQTDPRDSSAAAITACGLLELASFGDETARSEAETLLKTLIEQCATFNDDAEDGLLKHATGNLPADMDIDISLIYGDYFFYEALNRLSGGKTCW